MFLSYEATKYFGYDIKTKLYKLEYKIVDSEFEEIGTYVGMYGAVNLVADSGVAIGAAVISTYEKRNLNIAVNLVRAFIWQSKKYNLFTVSDIIKLNKRYNPKFAKYEEEINKYLILL